MKQSIGEIVADLIGNLKTYVISKIDLYQISIFEKFAKVQASVLSAVILILISFFCLFFITVAIAVWLGSMLNNYAYGFLIVGLGYFLLGILFLMLKKSLIDKPIIKSMLKALFKDDQK